MDATLAEQPSAELLQWMKLVGAGVSLATFCGYDACDRFLIVRDADELPVPAASTVALRPDDAGSRVVVAYEGGDMRRPVVIGRLQPSPQTSQATKIVRIDGEKLLLEAEREIELRCGESSITLTRAGKVLIRGNYVLSRSRGANRIKGAHVDIN